VGNHLTIYGFWNLLFLGVLSRLGRSREDLTGGHSIAELIQQRDRCPVAVMRALETVRGIDGPIP